MRKICQLFLMLTFLFLSFYGKIAEASESKDENPSLLTQPQPSLKVHSFIKQSFQEKGILLSDNVRHILQEKLASAKDFVEMGLAIWHINLEEMDMTEAAEVKFLQAYMISNQFKGTAHKEPADAYPVFQEVYSCLNPVQQKVADYCIGRMVACDQLQEVSGDKAYDLLTDEGNILPHFFKPRSVFYRAHLRVIGKTQRLDDGMAMFAMLGIKDKLVKLKTYADLIDKDLETLHRKIYPKKTVTPSIARDHKKPALRKRGTERDLDEDGKEFLKLKKAATTTSSKPQDSQVDK